MRTRSVSLRSRAGAGLAVVTIVLASGLAGCDDLDFRVGSDATTTAAPDLSALPEEFVATIQQSKPTIVDFYATWCGPCQEQKPQFEEAERQYGDVANFLVVDVDESPEIALAYDVSSIPTLIVFQNGEPVGQLLGVHSTAEIGEAVTRYAE